ncbi:MAG: hypothetical protein HW421_2218 [Ignavibacteria bacterium]|nr:hypothetical protein [Ignavibacteria bacterium]
MKTYIYIIFLLAIVVATNPASAKTFDGKNDIEVITNTEKIKAKAITIETYIKVNGFNSYKSNHGHNWQFIAFKKSTLPEFNEGFAIFLDDNLKRFAVGVASEKGIQKCCATEAGFVELNKWYRVTLTADSKKLSLYIDGKLQNSIQTGFPLDFGTEQVLLGGREIMPNDGNLFEGRFNGTIDYVKVWDGINIEKDQNIIPDNLSTLIADWQSQPGCISSPVQSDMQCSVMPNPISELAKFTFNNNESSSVKINISSINGINILEKDLGLLSSGFNEFTLDLSNLSSGMYICTISNPYRTTSLAFEIIK